MDFGPCYNCEKPSHLFPDGRCKNCTRLTPEEVTGEVSMSRPENITQSKDDSLIKLTMFGWLEIGQTFSLNGQLFTKLSNNSAQAVVPPMANVLPPQTMIDGCVVEVFSPVPVNEPPTVTKDLSADLKALGSGESNYKFDGPDFSVLEAFPRPESGVQIDLKLNITCPEFTSLCPKTGQPDFATIVINYRPLERCVESKSLKMYLNGFRNHGEFHEACVTRICDDLVKLLNPLELEVIGQFTPRGGIPFWPTAHYTMKD